MSVKRTTILEEMYNTIATPTERREIDLLYSKNQKGVATAKMLRRLHSYWMKNIAKKEMKNGQVAAPRTIKITHLGISNFEAIEEYKTDEF